MCGAERVYEKILAPWIGGKAPQHARMHMLTTWWPWTRLMHDHDTLTCMKVQWAHGQSLHSSSFTSSTPPNARGPWETQPQPPLYPTPLPSSLSSSTSLLPLPINSQQLPPPSNITPSHLIPLPSQLLSYSSHSSLASPSTSPSHSFYSPANSKSARLHRPKY